MTIAMKTRPTRYLGGIAAAGAVALLLAGSTATTTEARRASPNAEIKMCFESGGDPFYFEYWGAWAVGCEYVSVTTGTNDDVASEQITTTDDRGTRATHSRHHRQHKHTHRARKRR